MRYSEAPFTPSRPQRGAGYATYRVDLKDILTKQPQYCRIQLSKYCEKDARWLKTGDPRRCALFIGNLVEWFTRMGLREGRAVVPGGAIGGQPGELD